MSADETIATIGYQYASNARGCHTFKYNIHIDTPLGLDPAKVHAVQLSHELGHVVSIYHVQY